MHIICGCYYRDPASYQFVYLPQVDLSAHTTIIGSSSRTVLRQTFENPTVNKLSELHYAFPLYDGVSVVGFRCTVGGRVIEGIVQERAKAKATYEAAKSRGETAGLLEQSLSAADAFSSRIGNVGAGEKVYVDITYLGELEHDAEVDGLRFTIPTKIAPRYGVHQVHGNSASNVTDGKIQVTVDVEMPAGSTIKSVQSPSHPIAVSVGNTSTAPDAEPSFRRATAGLTLGTASLATDFILHVVATNLGDPTALLETHPTLPNQRALMTTLVPKFSLPAEKPEIVFICDRSGSMDNQIPSLISALNIFLKSLPVGVKFNICSFGSRFEFLWSKSKTYSQETLDQAIAYVSRFDAHFGGTEMYKPIEETFKRRYSDMNLEVFVLTDGEIWQQDELFAMMNKHVRQAKGAIRVFSLGVGSGASTSLVNGIARAGDGFAQFVQDNEKMDKKIVRMLRASLFPHITDYSLEIKYSRPQDSYDDFELVEKVNSCLNIAGGSPTQSPKKKPIISLFQKNFKEDSPKDAEGNQPPGLPPPRYLQTPGAIPPLFPFSRTTVYVLLSDACPTSNPEAVVLRGTCAAGPLELEIPITVLGEKATTIHQLAARKEMKELEEGRGWVSLAKSGKETLKQKYPGRYDDMVEREGVRLGTTFQVGGKWCSFVAVEQGVDGDARKEAPPDYDDGVVDDYETVQTYSSSFAPLYAPSQSVVSGMGSFGSRPSPPRPKKSASIVGALMASASSAVMSSPAKPASSAPRELASSAPRMSFGLAGAARRRSSARSGAAPPPPPRVSAPAPLTYSFREAEVSASAPPPGAAIGGGGYNFYGPPCSAPPPPPDLDESLDALASSAPPLPFLAFRSSAPPPPLLDESRYARGSSPEAGFPVREQIETEMEQKGQASQDVLQALAGLQLFEGNWAWTPQLAAVLGVRIDAARVAAPGHADDVLATVCAVAYLKNRLAEQEDVWEMMVEKAEAWLRAQSKDAGALEKAVLVLLP